MNNQRKTQKLFLSENLLKLYFRVIEQRFKINRNRQNTLIHKSSVNSDTYNI